MPFWATRPKAERSSELRRPYQGSDFSSWRMVLVDSWPTLARSCRRVSAFSGDNAWDAALRLVVVLLGSAWNEHTAHHGQAPFVRRLQLVLLLVTSLACMS